MNPVKKLEFNVDFQPYVDRYGMIQNETNGSNGITSGNGNLYTAHYIIAAKDHGLLDGIMKFDLTSVYMNNEKLPGLMSRSPDKNDHNAHDDLIGCATFSRFCDNGALARRIIDYGRTQFPTKPDISEGPYHKKTALNKKYFPILNFIFRGKIKWNWNNAYPKQFHITTWLFRRRDVISTLELVGYKKTSLFGYLYLTVMMLGILTQDKKADHNAFILRYHQARAIQGINWYTTFIANLVIKRVEKVWGSFGAVIGAYYVQPDHPSAKWNSKD